MKRKDFVEQMDFIRLLMDGFRTATKDEIHSKWSGYLRDIGSKAFELADLIENSNHYEN